MNNPFLAQILAFLLSGLTFILWNSRLRIWNFITGKRAIYHETANEENEIVEESILSIDGNKDFEEIDDSSNKQPSLWIAVKAGGIAFFGVIIAVTLFQFFLQFTLAPDYWNTPKFWIEGIFTSLSLGAMAGIVLALIVGFITWSKASPTKRGSVAYRRNIIRFALIVFIPFALLLGFMLFVLWLFV